jgi:hypothetical protein
LGQPSIGKVKNPIVLESARTRFRETQSAKLSADLSGIPHLEFHFDLKIIGKMSGNFSPLHRKASSSGKGSPEDS